MSFIKKTSAFFLFFFCVFFLSTSTLLADSSTSSHKLSKGSVFPSWAVAGDAATYRVYYDSADSSVPDYVRLHLGSYTYNMQRTGVGSADTDIYEFTFRVPDDWEQPVPFFFTAQVDGKLARFPVGDDSITGPIILDRRYDDNKIVFMDGSGEVKWTYSTGSDWVQNLVLSDDGNYLVAKTTDKIHFFSTETSNPVWTYVCQPSNQGKNIGYYGGWADLSDNGEFVAGGCQNALHIFNRYGRIVWSYPARISVVSNSENGFFTAVSTLAGGIESKPGQIILFSNATRKPIWNHFADGNVSSVAVSGSGEYVASGGSSLNSSAYLFLLSGPEPLLAYPIGSSDSIEQVATSADGNICFYGIKGASDDGDNILVYSVKDREFIRTYSLGGAVYSLSVSEDGQYIAAGGENKVFNLWDRDAGTPIWELPAQSEIGAVAISGNGGAVSIGDKSGTVYYAAVERGTWDSVSGPLWSQNFGSPIDTVTVSFDGSAVAVGTGPQRYVGKPYIPEYDSGSAFTMCGDGVCSPLWGEDEKTCPEDCGTESETLQDGNGSGSSFNPFSFLGSPPLQLVILLPTFLMVTLILSTMAFFVFKFTQRKRERSSEEPVDSENF